MEEVESIHDSNIDELGLIKYKTKKVKRNSRTGKLIISQFGKSNTKQSRRVERTRTTLWALSLLAVLSVGSITMLVLNPIGISQITQVDRVFVFGIVIVLDTAVGIRSRSG